LDNPNEFVIIRPVGERVAALEVRIEAIETTLKGIEEKLDELLSLKHKGLGALSLVSILVGSGFLGLLALVFNLFGHH
jgi:hypothetical protein